MNLLAVALAIVGTAVLCAAIALRRERRGGEPWEPETVLCEAPSPDDSLRCDQEAGHYAWHRADGSEWFGDNWAVSEWADTQEWPVIVIQDETIVENEPTMTAQAWAAAERKRKNRLAKTAVAARPYTREQLERHPDKPLPRRLQVWNDDPDLARLRAATHAAVKAAQRERRQGRLDERELAAS